MKRKIYLEDHNNILLDIRKEFEVVSDWRQAEAVVVWQDVRGELVGLVTEVNKTGIPTVVVEHGVRAYRDYLPPVSKILLASKLLVWGPRGKKRMIDGGHDSERIEVTGTDIFKSLKPREKHDGFNVLFVPLHWDKDLNENVEVARELRKIKNINITTKIVDGQGGGYYDNPILSHRDAPDHLKICAEVLARADVVVSLFESTFEFMAYYLDIPVVVVDNWWPKRFLDTYVANLNKDISRAANFVKIGDLEKAIWEDNKKNERKVALFEEAQVAKGRVGNVIRSIMRK